VQTDPKVWREWRQLSGAEPYTISVTKCGASAAGGEESPAPETPVAAGGAKAQTPRLAMLLPCSRPRKPYPSPEDVQLPHEDASSSGANDSLHSPFHSPFHSPDETRGVGNESSVRMQVRSALDQVQTAVVAFLSPRGSEASPPRCVSPRSTL